MCIVSSSINHSFIRRSVMGFVRRVCGVLFGRLKTLNRTWFHKALCVLSLACELVTFKPVPVLPAVWSLITFSNVTWLTWGMDCNSSDGCSEHTDMSPSCSASARPTSRISFMNPEGLQKTIFLCNKNFLCSYWQSSHHTLLFSSSALIYWMKKRKLHSNVVA